MKLLRIYCYSLSFILFLFANRARSLEFPPGKKTYAVYEAWKSEERSAINFHFKTYKSEAHLMFQDSGSLENWIKLKIAEGVLIVSLKTKNDLEIVSFDHSVSDLKWHQVKLQWKKHALDIDVDEFRRRIEIPEIPFLKSDLHFGAVTASAKDLVSFSRYEGCIASVKYIVDGEKQFEPRLLFSSNTRPGCTDACANTKLGQCHNAGRCVDRIFSATCDCLGTGYEDYDCSKKSLIAWTNGTSYVIYDVARNPRSSLRNFIVFRFKTPDADAIILQTSMAKDFLRIGLEDGSVKVAVSLGAGTLQVTAGNGLNDDKWHSVKVSRVGREISLVVDDHHYAHDYTAGDFHRLDHGGESVIYIAGAPAQKNLPWRNFRGYLQQFIYDDMSILDKTFYTFDNRFITIGDMSIVF